MLRAILSLYARWKNRVDIAAESQVGLVRKQNEDNFVYAATKTGRNTFIAVADGIGGNHGGEIASKMCGDSMLRLWRAERVADRIGTEDLAKFLEFQIETANADIFAENQRSGIRMGCTIVAVIITPSQIIVGNAGDSRCYGMAAKSLNLLSFDHTLRQLVLSRSQEALLPADLPPPNIISKAVGPRRRVSPTIAVYPRKNYHTLLLCTDGLTGMVEDDFIERILRDRLPARIANGELMCAALKNGGKDNVTIITCRLS